MRTPGGGPAGAGAPGTQRGARRRSRSRVWDPPAWLEALEADDAVVVVGTSGVASSRPSGAGEVPKAEVEAVTVAERTGASASSGRGSARAGALDVLT